MRHRPARPHVVDDLRAGLLLEHGLGEERGHEVAGDELAGVVYEEAAVGVAVEGDSEVGLLFLHLADDELAVLGEKRVRLVVREGAVRLEEAAHRVHGQALEDGGQHRARHAVSGVDDDAKRLDLTDVDEGEDTLDESGVDVHALGGRVADELRALDLLGPVAHVEEARIAADGEGAAPDDLHPRVLLRVVRGGDHDAAVEVELADSEIEHFGADHPDVLDLGAAVGGPLHDRPGDGRGRDAHVAPDRDRLGLELLDVRPAHRIGARLVQLGRVDAAHVVRLEGLRV